MIQAIMAHILPVIVAHIETIPSSHTEVTMQNRIAILRQGKGLSLTELAKAAGTTKAQIQKLERGHRRLSLEWMDRLARALDVRISDLLPHGAVTCQHGPEEQEILAIVSQLPVQDRIALIKMAGELLSILRRWDDQPSAFGEADLPALGPTSLPSPTKRRAKRA